MKSTEELQDLLATDILKSVRKIDFSLEHDYYNEYFEESSFILAAILEKKLKALDVAWIEGKWIDDSLFTKVKVNNGSVSIWGVMIWGRINTTVQWTSPFYFEIKFDKNRSSYTENTFLFEEESIGEVTYEEFDLNRGIWDQEFYSNENWNPSEREWGHIIHSKNGK